MIFWELATWVAWLVSAAILGWMLYDVIRVSQNFDEDFLQSAREGSDELLEEFGNGGARS